MLLKNNDIYNYAIKMNEAFIDENQKFPIKLNFYLQKNKNTLFLLAQELEATKKEIILNHSELDENNNSQYVVSQDQLNILTEELNNLFDLEQEVNIYKINIDNMPEDLILTAKQMDAIMFMIE